MPDQSRRPPNRHKGSSCYCFDIVENETRSGRGLERYRTDYMHAQSSRLISSWFYKAVEQQNVSAEDAFEPFIYAWFAFNGWAACVTNEDNDSRYMRKLISDSSLQDKFSTLMERDEEFRVSANAFAECWPIFTVKSLRDHKIVLQEKGDRGSVVQHYLDGGAKSFQPQCWKEHRDRNESCPCDWPHTIAAIYRVRCNLFHGEKAATSPIDQQIVQAAFRVLVGFVQKAELL